MYFQLLLFLIFHKTSAENSTLSDIKELQNDFVRSPYSISQYLQDVMKCGSAGWCFYRCCAEKPSRVYRSPIRRTASAYPSYTGIRNYPISISENAIRTPYIGISQSGTPYDIDICPKACQPQCSERCIQRYQMIVTTFMNTLTANDITVVEDQMNIQPPEISPIRSFGFRVEDDDLEEPLCRVECMPRCTAACIANIRPSRTDNVPKCRPSCMPQCLGECVRSPPIMVPCPAGAAACYCPAGYVQCSENTCCMRYRTMAVRYNNHLVNYAFGDEASNKQTSTSSATAKSTDSDMKKEENNQMSVYMKNLRKMGNNSNNITATAMKELPKDGKVVYYPKEKRAEIVFNDGEILVEHIQ